MVEAYTGRFLQPTLGTFYFDDFHEFMNLHGGPNMTIVADDGHGNNHGVTYTNTSSVETVINNKDFEYSFNRKSDLSQVSGLHKTNIFFVN